MEITKGWRFYSADGSMAALGRGNELLRVVLIRDSVEREKWHRMPYELKEDDNGPPFSIQTEAATLEEAIAKANRLAEKAMPIITDEVSVPEWKKCGHCGKYFHVADKRQVKKKFCSGSCRVMACRDRRINENYEQV